MPLFTDHPKKKSFFTWLLRKGPMSVLVVGLIVFLMIDIFRFQNTRHVSSSPISETDSDEFVSTPRGERKEVSLPDGSHIWLNASSTVRFARNMTAGNRTVELSGEAYFDVRRKLAKPFFVKSKDLVVQVLGTRFNIRSYAEEASFKTTVTDGAIKVIRGDDAVVLGANEALVIDPTALNGAICKRYSAVDTESVVSWTKGVLDFNDADLATILHDLSRAYNVDIEVDGNVPPDKFNCSFHTSEPLEEIIQGLIFHNVKVTAHRKGAHRVIVAIEG